MMACLPPLLSSAQLPAELKWWELSVTKQIWVNVIFTFLIIFEDQLQRPCTNLSPLPCFGVHLFLGTVPQADKSWSQLGDLPSCPESETSSPASHRPLAVDQLDMQDSCEVGLQ